jgi:nucleotide-binding universal stress UspA family protein
MPSTKIALVGDDGSPQAGQAVSWAEAFAATSGSELVVVGVADRGGPESAGAVRDDLERRVVEPARALGLTCRCEGFVGDPRRVLLERAVDLDASLTIVGDTGHWAVLRPPLGSVAGYLVHHSAHPVVVVPAAGGPLPGGRLVVGVDGSAGSAAALQWAAAFARAVRGSVVATFVHDLADESYPHPPQASAWHHSVEPKVRAAVDAVNEPGVDVELRTVAGHRVEALLEVADEVDSPLLVVGARGSGGFRRLLLGGTAVELLHHSTRPIAVVPFGRFPD